MWKDGLQPVFDKMLSADAVFMGSPIYLGNVSGMMYCLMERLVIRCNLRIIPVLPLERLMKRVSVKCGRNNFQRICRPPTTLVFD